ncbi:MAG: phosphoribosylamine--glycine ligase [Dehalococcoidia bacterium]|nr:phosphoribosylamine--glycine ligase [Dehalococcoidia bacterium]MDZ4247014.1 phosphoribosylamine--glycine ligase [Dehalococcoidia bacterium]
MKVLIIGQGAREHALAWKMSLSEKVREIIIAPGNGGTAAVGKNLDVQASDIKGLVTAAVKEKVDLAVIGPEAPLTEGIVDIFEKNKIPVFGPTKQAARIEGSKVFARTLMEKYGIPCARGEVFDSFSAAKKRLETAELPIVVKADGLAAGKGVIVAGTREEALKALSDIMEKKIFGAAGDRVIIEECLTGRETSLLAFSDGETVVPMVPACDYKRIFDNDQGPNTGGMGGYSPPSFFDSRLQENVVKTVLEPVVKAMETEGCPYKGVLYAGIMVTPAGPKVLEFNARFGDPETQVILPRLKTDLVDIMEAVISGKLDKIRIEWSPEACVGVVLASAGYPGSYRKGFPIRGLKELDGDILAFHAGTKQAGTKGETVTDGGRVLTLVAKGAGVAEARTRLYRELPKVQFQGAFWRKDIAAREN